MAEIESKIGAVPPPPPLPAGAAPPAPAPTHTPAPAAAPTSTGQALAVRPAMKLEEMSFRVKEFNPDGSVTDIAIPLPTSADFAAWAFTVQVGMLKMGPWKKISIPEIAFGLAYANLIGANVLEGDLFPTGDGRWGTSNKFKIKRGLKSGKIKGYNTEIKETPDPLPEAIASKCVSKRDLECTVTLDVEGLNQPVKRKAKLSRWFNPGNPNWCSRPEHMLELNTLAHAIEFVDPIGTEDDEAPPVDAPLPSARELRELAQTEKAPVLNLSEKVPPPPPSPSPMREVKKGIVIDADTEVLPDPSEVADVLTAAQEMASR